LEHYSFGKKIAYIEEF